MRKHHTKNKGDLGVLFALADLAEKGFGVLSPLTEHEVFDLVAYQGKRFWRIQVKYRSAVNGGIDVPFRSFWADRKGSHMLRMDKEQVDVVCVYCPDTRACYYVNPKKFRNNVRLRLAPTRNNQHTGVSWADRYRKFPPP